MLAGTRDNRPQTHEGQYTPVTYDSTGGFPSENARFLHTRLAAVCAPPKVQQNPCEKSVSGWVLVWKFLDGSLQVPQAHL